MAASSSRPRTGSSSSSAARAIRTLPAALARHNNLFQRFYAALPTLVELGPILHVEWH